MDTTYNTLRLPVREILIELLKNDLEVASIICSRIVDVLDAKRMQDERKG